MNAFQVSSHIPVFGIVYCASAHFERICNCRSGALIVSFLRWVMVFVNDVRVLLDDGLTSVIAFLHEVLLFLVV